MKILMLFVYVLFAWGFLALDAQSYTYDVAIVGHLGTETSMPIVTTAITKALYQKTKVAMAPSRSIPIISARFKKDIPLNLKLLSFNTKESAPISILTDWWYEAPKKPLFSQVPSTPIKYIYSMFESDFLPKKWVDGINKKFDAVIVPHKRLIEVYKQSGIKIPLFSLTLPVLLEDILALPAKIKPSHPFTFGISAGYSYAKGYEELLHAFAQEFGNNSAVQLKIHCSWGNRKIVETLIDTLKLKNVILIKRVLTREDYISFIRSCDCYILASWGEGYSITPREALAAGVPCILSNHRAHRELCTLPSVIGVEAVAHATLYKDQYGSYTGYPYKCSIPHLRSAMRTMYTSYDSYIKNNQKGRLWAACHTAEYLAPYYKTLVKPTTVIRAKTESIEKDKLIIQSKGLYKKYRRIFGGTKISFKEELI